GAGRSPVVHAGGRVAAYRRLAERHHLGGQHPRPGGLAVLVVDHLRGAALQGQPAHGRHEVGAVRAVQPGGGDRVPGAGQQPHHRPLAGELAAAVRVERSRAGVLRVRGAPAAVEDVVGGDLDQPCAGGGAGPGEVGDRAPVDGGGGRLVGLGGVHGGPGGGVDHHVVPAHRVGERRPV